MRGGRSRSAGRRVDALIHLPDEDPPPGSNGSGRDDLADTPKPRPRPGMCGLRCCPAPMTCYTTWMIVCVTLMTLSVLTIGLFLCINASHVGKTIDTTYEILLYVNTNKETMLNGVLAILGMGGDLLTHNVTASVLKLNHLLAHAVNVADNWNTAGAISIQLPFATAADNGNTVAPVPPVVLASADTSSSSSSSSSTSTPSHPAPATTTPLINANTKPTKSTPAPVLSSRRPAPASAATTRRSAPR